MKKQKTKRALRPWRLVLRALGDLLIALALFLTVDVIWVMGRRTPAVVLQSTYRTVFLYELILCAVLVLFTVDLRFRILTRSRNGFARFAGRVLRAGLCVATAVIVLFCGKVVIGGALRTTGPAHNAVVLGAALENGQPSSDLIRRLDTAEKWLKRNPSARLVLSGGNPDETGKTEAAAMREILLYRGVDPKNMLLEEESATTAENFTALAKLIPRAQPTVLITSDYHMDRAVARAKRAGFTQIVRLPAPSDPLAYGANMLWEVVMNVNDLISA